MASPVPDSPPLFDTPAATPDATLERALALDGCVCVAGVDEAGRGPLAGPVVAAAVVLDPAAPVAGLNDSKKLTAARRTKLFEEIMADARAVGIAASCSAAIDRTDIRKATLQAMRACIEAIAPEADGALFDGQDVPNGLRPAIQARAVVRGDERSVSIAAASIIAKVTRDRMLARLCEAHPGYGLSGHKGYGSARHRETIAKLGGIRRVHRFTFRPLSER